MRRLPAKLAMALGRIPREVDPDGAYDRRSPPPEPLIGPDGEYRPGWFTTWPSRVNLDDASGPRLARQAWQYVHFDTPDRFVAANVAHMGIAGNVAVLVVNKRTGAYEEASHTDLFLRNRVEVQGAAERLIDRRTGSTIRQAHDGAVEVSVDAGRLKLFLQACPRFPDPFVQATRYHRGHGTLQLWCGLSLRAGVLVQDGHVTPLPAGTPGVLDRTVGHRPSHQAWNWLAVAGTAKGPGGEERPYAVQLSKDRAMARPRVRGDKGPIWLGDRLLRATGISVEYARDTPWRIRSADGLVDLTFHPRFHRRERKRLVVVHADFHQFYGEVEGRLQVEGQPWEVQGDFAVAEESLLQL